MSSITKPSTPATHLDGGHLPLQRCPLRHDRRQRRPQLLDPVLLGRHRRGCCCRCRRGVGRPEAHGHGAGAGVLVGAVRIVAAAAAGRVVVRRRRLAGRTEASQAVGAAAGATGCCELLRAGAVLQHQHLGGGAGPRLRRRLEPGATRPVPGARARHSGSGAAWAVWTTLPALSLPKPGMHTPARLYATSSTACPGLPEVEEWRGRPSHLLDSSSPYAAVSLATPDLEARNPPNAAPPT